PPRDPPRAPGRAPPLAAATAGARAGAGTSADSSRLIEGGGVRPVTLPHQSSGPPLPSLRERRASSLASKSNIPRAGTARGAITRGGDTAWSHAFAPSWRSRRPPL